MMNVKPIPAIIILIAFSAVLLWAFSGFCPEDKVEAEVTEPGSTILGEPNDGDVLIENPEGNYIWVADEINESEVTFELAGGDLTWADSIYLEVTLTDEPTFEDGETKIYLYEGDEFDIVIEKKESDEHKPDTTKLVGGLKKIAELIEYYHER